LIIDKKYAPITTVLFTNSSMSVSDIAWSKTFISKFRLVELSSN